jgi:hypothetical protein
VSQQTDNDARASSGRNLLTGIPDILLHPFLFFDSIPLHGRLIEPIVWCAIIFLAPAIQEMIESHDIGKTVAVWSVAFVAQPLLVLGIWGLCKLFKGSGNFTDTFRVQAYSNLVYIFAWIPWFGFLVWFYKIVLLSLGLARVHRLSWDKAFYAAVIGTLAPLIVILLAATAFFLITTHHIKTFQL